MWIAIQNAIGARQGVGGGPGPGPGPGYTPPLDDYTGATAAYSVRKLSSSYSGSCIEAYRVSDGATQDIGFDADGLIDTAAIVAFGGVSEVRVSRWYDQSGNSNDGIEIGVTGHDRPTIYTGASIITDNGNPAIRFQRTGSITGTGLRTPSTPWSTAGALEFFMVFRNTGAAGDQRTWSTVAANLYTGNGLFRVDTSGNSPLNYTQAKIGVQNIFVYEHNPTAQTVYIDGLEDATNASPVGTPTSSSAGGIGIRYNGNEGHADVLWQELIHYPVDQSSVRAALESNINSFYQVTNLPDYTSGFLADYPDAAAAYSVRQLSNTAIKCMRVRRAVAPFDEQDIGFTAGGDLDEAAIVAFGGSDVLLVSAWYDQSGQSRHATQITPNSQPQIYDGAAVITENGKAALDFISNSSRSLNGPTFSNNSIIGFCVAREVVRRGTIWGLGGGLNYKTLELQYWDSDLILVFKGDGTNYDSVRSPTLTDDNAQHLVTLSRFSNALKTFVDGTADINTTDSYSANSGALGFATRNTQGQLLLQEAIFYETDQVAAGNRTGIETNINTYYDVYTMYNPDAPTSGFLFDYPDASTAYSVRQLNNNATVSMRVRRAVAPFDEQDIGFVNGDLDEAAIVAFGGSDALTVSAWYDQSGNQRHATQITPGAQPQIYNGTAVLTENGKPAVDFDGTTFLKNTDTISAASDYTIYFVENRTADIGYSLDSEAGRLVLGNNQGAYFANNAWRGNGLTQGAQYLNGYYLLNSGAFIVENGTVTQTGLTYPQVAISTTTTIYVNALNFTSRFATGNVQEILIWNSDQDDAGNRTGIETNINTYFSIYT